MTEQTRNSADSVSAQKVQGHFEGTPPGSGKSRGNGAARLNGHDEQAYGGPQKGAEGRGDQDPCQGAQGLNKALRSPEGQDNEVDGDNIPGFTSKPSFDAAGFAAVDVAQGLEVGRVQLTILENTDGSPLNKRFSATPDGETIDVWEAARNSVSAIAIRVWLDTDQAQEIASLQDLAHTLKRNQCFITAPLPGDAPTRPVIFKDQWEALPPDKRALNGDGPVYRGVACFNYPAGQPAIWEMDIDTKDWSVAIQEKEREAGGLLPVVLPAINRQFATAGCYGRPSSSAGVRDKRTQVMLPIGALHAMFVAQDGADVPRASVVVFQHLVIAGYGFAKICKNGEIEIGSPIDPAASGRPERLWYDAKPGLFDNGHGRHLELVAEHRQEWVREGPRFDTHQLADLSEAEKAEYERIVAELEAAAKPEADRVREAHMAVRVERAVAAGVPRDVARQEALAAIDGGRLDVGGEYKFDDGTWRTGWEILKNAASISGKLTAADPLEPDYGGGRNKSIWYREPGEPGVFCYSFAHGKHLFRLGYDGADWVVLVQREIAGGVTPACLQRLKDAGRHYLPSDAVQAHALLCAARVPPAMRVDFIDADELAPERIMAAVRAKDWPTLAGLRADAGVIFDRVWMDTRAQAELGLLGQADSDAIDWDDAEVSVVTGAQTKPPPDDPDTDPIVPTLPPPAPYPVASLPGLFGEAVAAAARAYEVDTSMAATIGLAVVATAVGKLALGVKVGRRLTPASLFTLSIVDSSERKTSIDSEMSGGIRQVEGERAEEYERDYRDYTWAKRVYESNAKRLAAQKGAATRRQNAGSASPASSAMPPPAEPSLDELSPDEPSPDESVAFTLPPPVEPTPPKSPAIITGNATVEGLRDLLAAGHGLVGVISSEGATVLAGHSLGRAEGKTASAGDYAKLWDGHSDNVTRAGRTIRVEDPRVSMSLGVQPRVAARFLHDPELMDQGLPNRFLVTQPTRRAGTRTLVPEAAADLATLQRFQERTADRLRQTLRIGVGAFADPPRQTPLTLTAEAEALRLAFAREIERAQAPGERFEFTLGMASKVAEQALRIALVLQLFEDPNAAEVGEAMMRAGMVLARWYADEWLRVTSVPQVPRLNTLAAQVLEWLLRNHRPGEIFTARSVYTSAAGGIRSRSGADKALLLLERTGHVESVGAAQPRRGRPPLVRWRLTAGAVGLAGSG